MGVLVNFKCKKNNKKTNLWNLVFLTNGYLLNNFFEKNDFFLRKSLNKRKRSVNFAI